MWNERYWARRYWAARYWPKDGVAAPAAAETTGLLLVLGVGT